MDALERLTLQAVETHSLIAVEHLHRYELAAELCRGLRVADVGCGSGYGSRLLRQTCPAVTGVDIDEQTIEKARTTVGLEADVAFELADANEFLRGNLAQDFDAVVMLEALEHLVDPMAALASLRDHASRGLRIVVSVPNSKWLNEDNPHHKTDFGFEEAVEAFEGFGDCVLLYQFLAEGSLIRRHDASETAGRLVATERGEPEYANHFIACINLSEALEQLPDWARMHLEAAPLHNRYVRNLEDANRELRRTNVRLGQEWLGKADSAAATIVARLELENRAVQSQLQREPYQRTEREAHLQRIEELHEQVLGLDRTMQQMRSTRAWRLVRRYWATRDAILRALRLRRGDPARDA